ncbi:hypothetical protein [Legionella quateirensis]|uniref:Uncharacterized protein n=1 Tax=Legionella quateirensis TaxID=45072 RepID=A0A378L0R2_9GAMM|nr:hypothetical protein [Legionella quateirensis]KTD49334.1 hypothetical protein Lqua_1786 [Legionella quateirensis]STY19431.1 Uncharacterised protein [Legionella quateirensis]
MSFFRIEQFVTYPDDAEKLREQILNDAINGPQKTPMTYFQDYFSKGGQIEHPLLGNLYDFASIIESKYGTDRGQNLVSGIIRFNLKQIEPKPDAHGASSSTTNMSFQ